MLWCTRRWRASPRSKDNRLFMDSADMAGLMHTQSDSPTTSESRSKRCVECRNAYVSAHWMRHLGSFNSLREPTSRGTHQADTLTMYYA